MSSINLRFINVSFSYDTSALPIIDNLTVSFKAGWTGIVGPNGIGKSTLAKLASGLLIPDKGSILLPDKYDKYGLYCPQTTEFYPDCTDEFLESYDNEAGRLRSVFEIGSYWKKRWNELSYGERKKLQIAVMLWKNPMILVLDEPANHIDSSTCESLIGALKFYEGIGMLISHNRMILDELCGECLFMDESGFTMRPGGISEGLKQKDLEEKNKVREYEKSIYELNSIKMSAVRMRREVNKKRDDNSKRNIDKKDHDLKSKIDASRLSGKDASGFKKVKQLESRVKDLKEESENKYFRKREIEGFEFNGEISKSDRLALIGKQEIILGNGYKLQIPEITIKQDDRIGITGKNGSGKTTLIRLIRKSIDLPGKRFIYIPQEIESSEVSTLEKQIRMLNKKDLGNLMSIIHRLGSEPKRLLDTFNPSPGEIRKMMLGLGLLKNPFLIMMDEPTNHMDLPSIECLENALKDFKGSLILISHDLPFLENLTGIGWKLDKYGNEGILSISHT